MHSVQLYSELGFLTNAVSYYANMGLWKGEAVVFVATPDHREAFTRHLAASGIDVERRRAIGQLTVLDADEMLSQFMVNGMPDRARFLPLFGSVIDLARARGGYPRLRAYGEMVDLLWQKGERAAAIRLEELWNELGATRSFSLHCAYAIDIFDPTNHCCSGLDDISRAHSHFIPAEHDTRFEHSVRQAVADVIGAADAPALVSRIVAAERTDSDMPAARAMLRSVAELAPETADAIFAQARRIYSPPSSSRQ
jgi:hypothetical protein